MDTFVEMKNRIIKFYRDGMFDVLKKADYEDLEEEEELELLIYITEEILTMPDDEQDNFIALLSLYYYITILSEISTEEEFHELLDLDSEFCNNVIRNMIGKSKDTFIDKVKEQENEMLDELVRFIIEEDMGRYTYMELENGIEEFDCWPRVKEVFKDKRHQNIFKKFHPNLIAESREYKKYYDNEELLKKMVALDLNSVGEFINAFLQAKQLFSNNDYIRYFLFQCVFRANDKKSPVLPQIMTFILKYYYVRDYLNCPERLDKTTREIAYALEDLEYNTTSGLNNFLNRFLNFDLIKYSEDFASLSPEVVEKLNALVNMKNREIYEDEGIWIKRDVKEKLNSIIEEVYIHCPEWENYLINANKDDLDVYIYYSKAENGEYSIPRVLMASNKDRKVEYLVGRYENGNIEFSMIPVVREKAKEYVNSDRIFEHMDFLEVLKGISEKVDKGEELTNMDTRILYNLTPDNNRFYQEYNDYIDIIRRKDDAKRSLSKYFNCRVDQIATSLEDITKDTMVTTEFMAPSSYIEPTNLRVIVGNAECTALQDASCLSKLRCITGSASFSLLRSSKGLENLIFIGKDADFRKLEDPENLNPDLFIGGVSKFKDTKKPKTYGNKNNN